MNDQTTSKRAKLKELGTNRSNQKATPGNYRACVILDSVVYQIGEDTSDRNNAQSLCSQYSNPMQRVQIFDDKGDAHIINGTLKPIYKETNSFLDNATSFFNKIMKQKYISKVEIIQLKRQLGNLKEQNPVYKTLFNKVTNIANKANGKNTPDILQGAYQEFNDLKS